MKRRNEDSKRSGEFKTGCSEKEGEFQDVTPPVNAYHVILSKLFERLLLVKAIVVGQHECPVELATLIMLEVQTRRLTSTLFCSYFSVAKINAKNACRCISSTLFVQMFVRCATTKVVVIHCVIV